MPPLDLLPPRLTEEFEETTDQLEAYLENYDAEMRAKQAEAADLTRQVRPASPSGPLNGPPRRGGGGRLRARTPRPVSERIRLAAWLTPRQARRPVGLHSS
jgi:hypothetical protein